MTCLEEIRSSAERLVTAASDALRLEMAIFDSDSNLFYCTPTYLKKKGRTVHTPSIQEVLENGSILVTDPGNMPACIGCRFKEHCPSTIEILCCIHADTATAGVLSFTSFTREGQRRITENTSVYLNAITELGNLLGDLIVNHAGGRTIGAADPAISAALEFCPQPLLFTDPHGVILQYNQLASNMLKMCNVSNTSLWQIFPAATVKKITEGNHLFEKQAIIGGRATKLTTRPVMQDGQPAALLVRMDGELGNPDDDAGFFGSIIGGSPAAKTMLRIIKRVADSPSPVLITGETGTGKELAARSIHEQNKRNKYPFVAINCSSIPENLFESELFGYEEGAFTGARKGGKMGKIEMAQGGTLFLDEIGELPLSIQPKLLRILQEYELERVGSNKKIHLDVRIIAATNRDLSEMVEEKTFREDLFYRLNVINLKLPPLRERKGDIMPIAENYLKKLHLKMETPLQSFSEEVRERFAAYPWPGNVRELQNAIEYAANICESDVMTLEDLPESLQQKAAKPQKAPKARALPAMESEARQLTALLEKYGHTLEGKKRIASELNISLRTLYRKLDRLRQSEPGAFSSSS